MSFKEELKKAIIAKNQAIYILTWEEERAEKLIINTISPFISNLKVFSWKLGKGIIDEKGEVVNKNDSPDAVLKFFENSEDKSILILKDFHLFWQNSPEIIRITKEVILNLKKTLKYIFFISSVQEIPSEISREIEIIEMPLPNKNELLNVFKQIVLKYQNKGANIKLNEEEYNEISLGLQGMTIDEATKSLIKLFHGKKEINFSILKDVHKIKKQIIMKESVLEFVNERIKIEDVGGLENLKDWLIKRKDAFSPKAREFGLDKPRGILVMGITGCGKSLSIKTIPELWKLPMFRLDMNLVYSGIGGEPEKAFNRALKLVESLSPAILWLDEIESGITDKQVEGPTSRILGYFLTWMQEHKSDIFVGATANRIDRLPAELLRRGRFDQIFFVDLPTWKEREEIFKVHLLKRDNDLSNFNISQLAQITKGWSGAEIEQVIISAMYEAYAEKRKLTEDDLFKIFGNTVPLSTTMAEQIKKIRSWAHDRAVRASKEIPEV